MDIKAAETKLEKLWNRNYVKVWSASFTLYFSFMLLTPLLPLYLSETFGATKETIGVVLSGYTITALLTRIFSGYIVDSFSRKVVLLIAYISFAAFFAGYLLAGTILFFTIVRTIHGAPFGAATVATATVAIDVLPSSRRAEGIGFFGLANNIATAISPTVALLIYGAWHSYNLLFAVSLVLSFVGFMINMSIDLPVREKKKRPPISLDRFFLLKGWSQSINIVCFAFAYGVVSTYIAIYGKEQFGITNGTGLFFALFAFGLIMSRLTGSRSLRKGRIVRNASLGMVVALCGYLLFAACPQLWAYYASALIIGLGNGHMYPAFQNIFINLAPNDRRGTANSTILVAWDVGVGLGILVGGVVAQYCGFRQAFWWAVAVNAVGVTLYFLYSRSNFLRNRLR